MKDNDDSSEEDDRFDLPSKGEQCSSLREMVSPPSQSTSLAQILEYSSAIQEMPGEYLLMNQSKESLSSPNPLYSLSASAVEDLGAWHQSKVDPSVYLNVPNTRRVWHQTGVDLEKDLAAKVAVIDPVQLYAARCRAIKKNMVGTMSRSKRTHEVNHCLCIIMNINGVNAYTLCDTGSTTDAISPAFAEACRLDIFDLDSVVGLQLGTTGSRSQIKHGALAQAIYGPITSVEYFDVYDIDRYDAIIGTVFMRAHGISVDFEHNVVRVKGVPYTTLTPEADLYLQERRFSAVEKRHRSITKVFSSQKGEKPTVKTESKFKSVLSALGFHKAPVTTAVK
jgi:hypothetical protein